MTVSKRCLQVLRGDRIGGTQINYGIAQTIAIVLTNENVDLNQGIELKIKSSRWI